MNTEENPKNKAALKLKNLHASAVYTREAKVCLLLEDAAGILHYLDELEAKVSAQSESDEPLVIGDTVEVIAEHVESWGGSLLGDRGTLVNIEPLADKYPYSVEFPYMAGPGKKIKYFARTELRKI